MKFTVKSFGCRVNQIEIESIKNLLQENGFIYDEKNYDIVIINSCCVTHKAENDVLRFIRKVVFGNPERKIIVSGCMASLYGDKIKDISQSIKIFHNEDKHNIVKYLCGKETDDFFRIKGFEKRSRAFIKIQDGCNFYCSYCIVPFARNKMKSKKFNEVINEITDLTLNGYKEIVLSGTRLGAYEWDGKRLKDLLREIEKINGDFRVRLSSLEPMEIDEELVYIMSNNKRFCSYFHIPLQSGSNDVLKSMKRPYTTEYFQKKVELIRKKIKYCGIYSDVIVGYPCETDKDFEKTVNFIKDLKLSGLHVFTYSPRKLTKAYELKDLDPKIKKERSVIMHKVDEEIREDFIRLVKGINLDAILLRNTQKQITALTTNFIEVFLKEKPKGDRFFIKITDHKNKLAVIE